MHCFVCLFKKLTLTFTGSMCFCMTRGVKATFFCSLTCMLHESSLCEMTQCLKWVLWFSLVPSPACNNHWLLSIMYHHLITIPWLCPQVIKSVCLSLSLSVLCHEALLPLAIEWLSIGMTACFNRTVDVAAWVTQVCQKLLVTCLQVQTDYSTCSLLFGPSQQRITGVLLMRASFFFSWRESERGQFPESEAVRPVIVSVCFVEREKGQVPSGAGRGGKHSSC